MRFIFHILAYSLTLSLALACVSSQKDELAPEQLDIRTDQSKARNLEIGSDQSDASAEKIFEWQHHFRSPPTKQQAEAIEQKIEAGPASQHPDELLNHARNLHTMGRLTEAEATYRRILRLDSRNFHAHLELAQLCLQRSDLNKAFEYIVAARRLIDRQESPPKAEVFAYKYTLALAYLARERRDEGHQILSDLIASEPGFVPAYTALASSYLSKQQYELAEFVATRGMDRFENHPDLMNTMGVISAQNGDLQQARRWYDRVLDAQNQHVPALVNRANLSLLRHEYAAAESDLNQAIAILPAHVNAHIAMGILYMRTGRFDSAKHSFERAMSLDPESSYARFNLAILLAERFQDRNQALRLFYEVLQTQDETQDLKTLARTHIHGLRQNRLDFQDN